MSQRELLVFLKHENALLVPQSRSSSLRAGQSVVWSLLKVGVDRFQFLFSSNLFLPLETLHLFLFYRCLNQFICQVSSVLFSFSVWMSCWEFVSTAATKKQTTSSCVKSEWKKEKKLMIYEAEKVKTKKDPKFFFDIFCWRPMPVKWTPW